MLISQYSLRNALQSLGMSAPPSADVTDSSKGKEKTEVGSQGLNRLFECYTSDPGGRYFRESIRKHVCMSSEKPELETGPRDSR